LAWFQSSSGVCHRVNCQLWMMRESWRSRCSRDHLVDLGTRTPNYVARTAPAACSTLFCIVSTAGSLRDPLRRHCRCRCLLLVAALRRHSLQQQSNFGVPRRTAACTPLLETNRPLQDRAQHDSLPHKRTLACTWLFPARLVQQCWPATRPCPPIVR
jgi:hypothetical protein